MLAFRRRISTSTANKYLEVTTMTEKIEKSVVPLPINRKNLLQRCMGNSALVEKLLDTFLDTLPSEKNSLREAIEKDDLTSVSRIAHKLRGTASNMCAIPLSDAALEVEQAARNNQSDLVNQRWSDLDIQLEKLMDALAAGATNLL